MNFVGNHPIKNGQIINALNQLLPIKLVPLKNLDHNDMNSLERLMAVGMSFTGNYQSLHIQFDTSKRDNAITPQNNDIKEDTVYKMLKYFIENVAKKGKKNEPVSVSQ